VFLIECNYTTPFNDYKQLILEFVSSSQIMTYIDAKM